ncbi:MAG: hypothetical protein OER86_08305, partial [Phycisphaerae bacterium]|nr:hypothetical protein [Phycisphaerae bacterium]
MSSSSYQASASTESSPSELIEHLVQFDGAPEQFLTQLLAVQCRVGQAESGAILRTGAQGQPEVLAINPPLPEGQTAPVWLAQAAEMTGQVLKSRESHAVGLYAPDELY